MKLSPKAGEATSVPAPESAAQLVGILDSWEPSCPAAGRAAQFLRRLPPGRPVVFRDHDKARAIEAYELELRTGMSRTSACRHVANSIAGFNTESKPESIERRLRNKLAAMEADPADRRIMDEMVLSISRRK